MPLDDPTPAPPLPRSDGEVTLELHPHRSLNRSGRRYCLYFTAGLALAPSALYAAIGLWGCLPFAMLELAIFGALFRFNARQSSDGQIIHLGASRITVDTRVRATSQTLELDRYWSRVRLSDDARVLLESKGRGLELGSFLSEPQRRELGRRLQRLVGGFGELPSLER